MQGAFAAHQEMLESLGATTVDVRQPAHLEGVDAVVIPGGESTTMSMQLERTGLFDPLQSRLDDGMPALGTCAGMILLANRVGDARPDQRWFRAIDVTVTRNGYGRQVDSFETELVPDAALLAGAIAEGSADRGTGQLREPTPLHAVFIRAPRVESVGPGVEVLAEVDGDPVLCRQGPIMVTSFHPELTPDTRIHEAFLKLL